MTQIDAPFQKNKKIEWNERKVKESSKNRITKPKTPFHFLSKPFQTIEKKRKIKNPETGNWKLNFHIHPPKTQKNRLAAAHQKCWKAAQQKQKRPAKMR